MTTVGKVAARGKGNNQGETGACLKNMLNLYQAHSQIVGRTYLHISTACLLDISPLDRSARPARRGAPEPPHPLPPSTGPPAFLLGQVEPQDDGRASHRHFIAVGQGARLQRQAQAPQAVSLEATETVAFCRFDRPLLRASLIRARAGCVCVCLTASSLCLFRRIGRSEQAI